MLKPSRRAEEIIKVVSAEIYRLGRRYGSVTAAGVSLGVSREWVRQVCEKHQNRIPTPSKMLCCKICGSDYPIDMKAPARYGVCRDCGEQQIFRCAACGASFRIGSSHTAYCQACRTKKVTTWFHRNPELLKHYREVARVRAKLWLEELKKDTIRWNSFLNKKKKYKRKRRLISVSS